MNIGTPLTGCSIKREPPPGEPGTTGSYTTVISNLVVRTFHGGIALFAANIATLPDEFNVAFERPFSVYCDWQSSWLADLPMKPKDILALPDGNSSVVLSAADTSHVTVADGTLFQANEQVRFSTGTSPLESVSTNTLILTQPLPSAPLPASMATVTREYTIRDAEPFPGSHVYLLIGIPFS